MPSFIPIYRGIDRVRFLTLPLSRRVHWHQGLNNKRRPINCSKYDCILCADGNNPSNLSACVGYNYKYQGIVEILSSMTTAYNAIKVDPRVFDLKIEAVQPMQRYKFECISSKPQTVIKPDNDLLFELINKILTYTSDLTREELYKFDPGFVQSKIDKKSSIHYNDAINVAISELEKQKVKINTYSSDLWAQPFNLMLANKSTIVLHILAARKLDNGELYSHASSRILNNYNKNDTSIFGNIRSMSKPRVVLLVHKDGDFQFTPSIDSIINEAKFEGILT